MPRFVDLLRDRIVDFGRSAVRCEPGVTPGSDFPTFVRSAIRYGINICNDANHADAAEQIARQGADPILYPLNNMLPPATAARWRETAWRTWSIARARLGVGLYRPT